MFSMKIVGDVSFMKEKLNLQQTLDSRTKVSPAEYDEIMELREKVHNVKNYSPASTIGEKDVWKGSFVLENVDELFRRTYKQV